MNDIASPVAGVGPQRPSEEYAAPNSWRASLGDGTTGDMGEVSQLRGEIRHLHDALASRAVIEQAKGMVMLRYGCNADAAFSALASWSQGANVKLRLIAAAMVSAISSGEPVAGVDEELVRWLEQQLREGLPVAAAQHIGPAAK